MDNFVGFLFSFCEKWSSVCSESIRQQGQQAGDRYTDNW